MKSKYWIKLYHEILDDPKMGHLSDRLYRRTIELFLLAGDFDQAGFLPPLEDIAWRLHLPEEQVETDLIELQRTGILDVIDGRWYVAKFAERQAADSNSARWQRWKERQHRSDYYSDQPDPPCPTDAYTNDQRTANDMFADKESDIDSDSEIESEAVAAAAADPTLIKILQAAGVYDPTASKIAKMPHITPEYLEAKIIEARQDKVNIKILITRLRNNDPPPLTPEEQDQLDRLRYVNDEYNEFIVH